MGVSVIKSVEIYSPEYLGKKDILLIDDKISRISNAINIDSLKQIFPDVDIFDAQNMICLPGIVDMHVHFNGAGGECSPQFRTPPLQLTDLTKAGITTAIGLLGTDGITRSLRDLYMKARALENEGMSTWIFTGSYQIPSPTITENISLDICMLEKVVGLKIAYSDHRSSNIGAKALIETLSASRVGGIVGGKSGKVMVHFGTPTTGLKKIKEIIEMTEIPLSQIIPTHLNRSQGLFNEAVLFGLAGGNVDLSAGISEKYHFRGAVKPSKAVAILIDKGVPLEQITMSSDGNGSMGVPKSDGSIQMLISPVKAMWEEFCDMVQQEGVNISDAISVVSTNPANTLNLPRKGKIKEDFDADLLLVSRNFKLHTVIAKGQKMVVNGDTIVKGVFE